MSYGFTVYTDRGSIATTKVYSSTSRKTYEYAYGTGQNTLNGFTDGDYLEFSAEPADGYKFHRWVYHIGSPTSTTQYNTLNPFKFYGSTDNDIYIAAEGVPKGDPSVSSCTIKTQSNSRIITVNIVGTNIIGCIVTLGLGYTDGTSMTIIRNIQITSESFSTKITAESLNTARLTVNIHSGSTLVKAYYLDVELDGGDDEQDYFEWSSAVAQGLPVKDVSHSEWDSFIDKIVEVLTDKGLINQPLTSAVYGYSVGTTYKTILNDCYMEYDSGLQGYPLTAQKFNIARFIIGSYVEGGSGIKTDKVSMESEVLASDLIQLADRLRAWQDQ